MCCSFSTLLKLSEIAILGLHRQQDNMYEGIAIPGAEDHDACICASRQSATVPGPAQCDRQSRGTKSTTKEKSRLRDEILHAI